MKRLQTVGTALIMGLLLVALPGCGKEEGPAEHAGKEIDKAMDQVGEKLDQAGEDIQDATKDDQGGD